MQKLEQPQELGEDVFISCLSTIKNGDLKNRLEKCKEFVKIASAEFKSNITTQSLHLIKSLHVTTLTKHTRLIENMLTVEEMKNIYSQKFVPLNSPGRFLYDKLISLPYLGMCPLCSHRDVSTLDHHLPKAHYPLLSVTPQNLVPSCKDCNISKKSICPTNSQMETLNPYYDDIEKEEWLIAEIIKSEHIVVRFKVQKPTQWTDLLFQRVNFHFISLKLNELYSVQSARELVQINHILKTKVHDNKGNGVRDYLIENANSRLKHNLNSWQGVLYKALGNDEWFCNEGFKY